MPHSPGAIASSTERRRYPEAEARLPWLTALLDAYAVLDAGVALAMAADGRSVACRAGCCACCAQPIPASTLEVLGLKWFAMERLGARERRDLGRTLRQALGAGCPFLAGGVCLVYPVRPLACREYVMRGRPCRRGERPERTRPGDVLPLPAAAQQEAFSLLLPGYGVTDATGRETALRGRLVLRDTGLLQAVNWSGLAGALTGKIPVDRNGDGA